MGAGASDTAVPDGAAPASGGARARAGGLGVDGSVLTARESQAEKGQPSSGTALPFGTPWMS